MDTLASDQGTYILPTPVAISHAVMTFKTRCLSSCRGHFGFVLVDMPTPDGACGTLMAKYLVLGFSVSAESWL